MDTQQSNQKEVAAATVIETEQPAQKQQVVEINIADIIPSPSNPRRYFCEDSLAELAQNIIEHGVLQPVTVRMLENNNGKYEIVFGERRFRASKIAGLQTIPCIVRVLDDEMAFDIAISENLARQNIRPTEEAEAFRKLLDKGNTIAYISERFGKSEAFIHSRLNLVRLIPEVAVMLDSEEITIGMAVEISRLEPDIQASLYKEHLDTGLNHNSWRSLSLKVFREKLEANYTVLLSRFSFDKSECSQCAYNSELHSLFPVMENSRCTQSNCLVKKQEKHMLDAILAIISKENIDVYINGDIHAGITDKLGELGIEVKSGTVYPMPENPVMLSEEDYMNDQTGYEQAQKDFDSKVVKWDALQKFLEHGVARKVITIENLEPVCGYVMMDQQKENMANFNMANSEMSNFQMSNSGKSMVDKKVKPKMDFIETLQEKDRKNKGNAISSIVEKSKQLLKDLDIPETPITAFEESLIFFIMLDHLDANHYEQFGFEKEQTLTDDEKFLIFNNLTESQKIIIKRDYIGSAEKLAIG